MIDSEMVTKINGSSIKSLRATTFFCLKFGTCYIQLNGMIVL